MSLHPCRDIDRLRVTQEFLWREGYNLINLMPESPSCNFLKGTPNFEMNNAIVGTAGHIDHGKTALIQALTGIDADRLKEEKLRGITIDLGFAHLFFTDLRIGFIDVPGHERFVHNMLAGIGGIDL